MSESSLTRRHVRLRGADAFFSPATNEEEKQDVGVSVEQGPVVPGKQQTGELINQDRSKTVNQLASRQGNQGTGKAEFMKATYYITSEQDMKLERLRLARRQQGIRVDKSALVREAIDRLIE